MSWNGAQPPQVKSLRDLLAMTANRLFARRDVCSSHPRSLFVFVLITFSHWTLKDSPLEINR